MAHHQSVTCLRQTRTRKVHTERLWPDGGVEHRAFLLWANSGNHCAIMHRYLCATKMQSHQKLKSWCFQVINHTLCNDLFLWINYLLKLAQHLYFIHCTKYWFATMIKNKVKSIKLNIWWGSSNPSEKLQCTHNVQCNKLFYTNWDFGCKSVVSYILNYLSLSVSGCKLSIPPEAWLFSNICFSRVR